VVRAEFLEHHKRIGNDPTIAHAAVGVAGLTPGDRWCVAVADSLRAYENSAASFMVLA